MNVDKFKVAHATINASLHNIRQMCQRGIRQEAGAIADEIVRMSSTIKLHLAAEDLHLYPILLSSQNADVAHTARTFKDEMGGLAEVYSSFSKKWITKQAIESAPEDFRTEANSVFRALFERIRNENERLYPLAEGM